MISVFPAAADPRGRPHRRIPLMVEDRGDFGLRTLQAAGRQPDGSRPGEQPNPYVPQPPC